MPNRFFQRAAWILPVLILTSACASMLPRLYTTPVRQGNYIDPATVAQLRLGMTRTQVQNLMGTPLLAQPFEPDQWVYYYQYTQQGQAKEQRRVTLIFRKEVLDQVQ